MKLFSLHKHTWEDMDATPEYYAYYNDGRHFTNTRPFNWAPEAYRRVEHEGVRTAITQRCIDCMKYRTQWVQGEYSLSEAPTTSLKDSARH